MSSNEALATVQDWITTTRPFALAVICVATALSIYLIQLPKARFAPVRPTYDGDQSLGGATPFIAFSTNIPNPLGDQNFRQIRYGDFNPGQPIVGIQTMYLYSNLQDALLGIPEGPSAVAHHPKMQQSGGR